MEIPSYAWIQLHFYYILRVINNLNQPQDSFEQHQLTTDMPAMPALHM